MVYIFKMGLKACCKCCLYYICCVPIWKAIARCCCKDKRKQPQTDYKQDQKHENLPAGGNAPSIPTSQESDISSLTSDPSSLKPSAPENESPVHSSKKFGPTLTPEDARRMLHAKNHQSSHPFQELEDSGRKYPLQVYKSPPPLTFSPASVTNTPQPISISFRLPNETMDEELQIGGDPVPDQWSRGPIPADG